MEPFLGEIRLFPWSWAPQGWMLCQGQILNMNEHMALFTLLGDRYGGDGRTTFGLPDLRGRAAVGENLVASTNPVLAVRELGTMDGVEYVALGMSNLAPHTHLANVSTTAGVNGPAGQIPAVSSTSKGAVSKPTYVAFGDKDHVTLNRGTIVSTPGYPIVNFQPSIGGNFCIAISGTYPPR
ncbi:phage tail protein [Pseudomonas protegens]|uniref:phage tail protein n=1 Tax=Pseudomonas protegens TaxID=380021 RepID=UPI001E6301A6|nr:tail fiber protein [Pseudomonas protegens]MCD9570208.1 tail fiber protein [Pseudomonas protegens]